MIDTKRVYGIDAYCKLVILHSYTNIDLRALNYFEVDGEPTEIKKYWGPDELCTPGKCLKICKLFDKIEPSAKGTMNACIYDVFQHSY